MAETKLVQGIVQIGLNAVQTRHTRVNEVHVTANPLFEAAQPGAALLLPEGISMGIETAFGRIEQAGNPVFVGKLTLELGDQGERQKLTPYNFRVIAEGLFEVVLVAPEVNLEQFVALHGGSALMSVARETVATITARSVHGPMFIPSVIFAKPGLFSVNPSGVLATEPAPKSEKA
ncbi:hypothetical protein [Usitatibacter rugosus]|uniref:hypothetical protein n=1 Tax=Usitatibacter rugosus TaxID=2732067 RepID=UPI0014899C9E|nr:hypothetical protein [Usitatibacter rugosus]